MIFRSIAAIFAAIVMLPVASDADHGRSRQHRGPDWKALDLTEVPRGKLEELRRSRAKAMARLRADLKVARIDLGAALKPSDPDPTAVRKGVAEVSRVRSKMLERRVDHLLSVKKVLSKEQLDKLKQMKRRGDRMGEPRPDHRRRGSRKYRGHDIERELDDLGAFEPEPEAM